jgi:hypothetical protein
MNLYLNSIFLFVIFLMFFIVPNVVHYGVNMADTVPGNMIITLYFLLLYGVIAITLSNTKKITTLYLVVIFAFFISGGTIHSALFGLMLMMFVENLITSREAPFLNAFKYIFLLNLSISIFQILGISDLFYYHLIYIGDVNSHTNILNLDYLASLDFGIFSTAQLRPAGIFPSTIYYGFFHLIFLTLLFFSKKIKHVWYFLYAFSAAISGSSLLFLMVIFLFFIGAYNKRVLVIPLAYLFFMFCIYYFQSDWFFRNYKIETLINSFLSRDLGSLIQILSDNWITIIALIGMTFSFWIKFSKYIFAVAILIIPLIVHNLFHSVGYLLLFGILVSYGSIFPKWAAKKIYITHP